MAVSGENHPSRVRADVTVNLNVRREIKNEWENLRKHDVLFLVTVRPSVSIGLFSQFQILSFHPDKRENLTKCTFYFRYSIQF